MPKRFHKHKLLLDENMPPRDRLRRLNQHFDVKHVRDDLKHGEIEDAEVYQLATSQDRIVITFNGPDFRVLVGKLHNDPGAIHVPANWRNAQVDTKLTPLLMRHGPAYFARHDRTLATETP